MARKKKREILTGIEIGTSTIKVVMGEFLPDDVISVVGLGETPSLKVVKGEVTDAGVVQEQLERALAQAEQTSGLEIGEVFLAVSGAHIQSVNSVGTTLVSGEERRITEDDLVTAARNAHGCTLPPDRQVLHYFDRFYTIDGSREVNNPLNMVGSKLDADVHVVYGLHNRLETACSLAADALSYPATDIAFSGVAAGFAAFSPEEAERGGLLIDIGAGVTEYVLLHGPGCFHSGQVTVGCEQIANDLALGLRLPLARGRKLLHDLGQFGSAVMTPDGRSRLISVDVLGHRPRRIPASTVEQVIELRLQELFEHILADLRAHGALGRIGSGVRVSGGGAFIPGVDRLAQHVFQMPASVARPRLLSGKEEILASPLYLTPVGLIRWGRMTLDMVPQETGSPKQQFLHDVRRIGRLLAGALKW